MKNLLLSGAALAVMLVGCDRSPKLPEKAPRPVTTLRLTRSLPAQKNQIVGSVQSWKTEQIGFEVGGRLNWVHEIGRNVAGEIKDGEGFVVAEGELLAEIDSSTFKLALKSTEAALEIAEQNRKVAEQEINSVQADLDLAQIEFDRAERLKAQNAISQAEYDNAVNRSTSLRARLEQAKAQVVAGDANVLSARQDWTNALRDRSNTSLYAPYAGQIADVHVVPGSIVASGSPIVTFQMMNPIKVEIEVSAAQSRRLQRSRQVGLTYDLPGGGKHQQRTMLHYMDPSADPSTRTFTATFLVLNQQVRPPIPKAYEDLPVARTSHLWPLNLSEVIVGIPGRIMVEENAIVEEGDKSYVWVVREQKFGDALPPILKVKREEVVVEDLRISFLGNWVFREAKFVNAEITDQNLVAGELAFIDVEEDKWDSESVFLDSGPEWALRPGDLANIYLDPDGVEPGFYVPAEAIYEDRGETYVFTVAEGSVKKVQVEAVIPASLDTGSMIEIQTSSDLIKEGTEIVVGGVHFLNDGDQVRVTEGGEGAHGEDHGAEVTVSGAES